MQLMTPPFNSWILLISGRNPRDWRGAGLIVWMAYIVQEIESPQVSIIAVRMAISGIEYVVGIAVGRDVVYGIS